MPLTNLKIYLYITGIISFVVYVSGLTFLSFGIMFSQKPIMNIFIQTVILHGLLINQLIIYIGYLCI